MRARCRLPKQMSSGRRSSKRMARAFRSSVLAPGICAGAPARGWSNRPCGLAIATSIRRRCTTTSARSAKGCAHPASSATKCSSPPRSGRRILPRATSSAPPRRAWRKLRLSEVDLLLLHWPNPNIPLAETLGALCKVKRQGLARHIGVSNFTVALIDEAVRLASEPLVCNQIEVHPFLDQSKVIAACRPMTWQSWPTARSRAAGRRTTRCWPGIGKPRRQDRRAGLPALSGAAGHRRHPAHQQGRAAVGEFRDLRLRVVAGRDGRDRLARAPRRTRSRLCVFRIAGMGLT